LGEQGSLVGAANQYTGTTKASISLTVQKGLVPLLQLDVSSFRSIIASDLEVRAVFLTCCKPSLAERISKR
jgi:hypothetical protein